MLFDSVSFRSALLASLVAALICFLLSSFYRWIRTRNDVLQTDLSGGTERGHIDIPSLKVDKEPFYDKSSPASINILQHNRYEHIYSYKYHLELISFTPFGFDDCDVYLPDGIGDGSEKTTMYSVIKNGVFTDPIIIDPVEYFQNDVIKPINNTNVLKAKPFDMTEDEIILGLTKTGKYSIRITTEVLHPNRRKTIKELDILYLNGTHFEYKDRIYNYELVSYLFDDELDRVEVLK